MNESLSKQRKASLGPGSYSSHLAWQVSLLIRVLFVLSTSQVLALEACTTMPALGNILLEHNRGCVWTLPRAAWVIWMEPAAAVETV